MSKENQDNFDDKDLREFKATEEYKLWYDSLFALIGYSAREEIDEKLARELIADHLGASFELQSGLEKARYNSKYRSSKELHDDWLLDNSGQ